MPELKPEVASQSPDVLKLMREQIPRFVPQPVKPVVQEKRKRGRPRKVPEVVAEESKQTQPVMTTPKSAARKSLTISASGDVKVATIATTPSERYQRGQQRITTKSVAADAKAGVVKTHSEKQVASKVKDAAKVTNNSRSHATSQAVLSSSRDAHPKQQL